MPCGPSRRPDDCIKNKERPRQIPRHYSRRRESSHYYRGPIFTNDYGIKKKEQHNNNTIPFETVILRIRTTITTCDGRRLILRNEYGSDTFHPILPENIRKFSICNFDVVDDCEVSTWLYVHFVSKQ